MNLMSFEAQDGERILVNPRHLVAVQVTRDWKEPRPLLGIKLRLTDGIWFDVKGSPEEADAMFAFATANDGASS